MAKPTFLERSKQMQLPDVVGLLCLTEKFRFQDLLVDNKVYEIDSLSPVYKSLYDEYLGTDSLGYPVDSTRDYRTTLFYHTDFDTKDKLPVFRTYFDWTSDYARAIELPGKPNIINAGNNWPIQVEIRIEFSEPRADTIQAIGGRKFLRGGTIQFLITAPANVFEDIKVDNKDAELLLGKPMGSIFRIAQFYIDKYGSTNTMTLLKDIPDIKKGLENISIGINQFEGTNIVKREQVLEILFPEADFDRHNVHYVKRASGWIVDPGGLPLSGASVFYGGNPPDLEPGLAAKSKEGDYYIEISDYGTFVNRIKSFHTAVAGVTNIRFTPKDRIPTRLFNTTYGLAVTVPFTFEQQK